MLTITQMQIILAVAETGSFSAAAEAMSMTQPAITLQIQTVEKRYNYKLFYRNGQRMELTEVGLGILETIKQILAQTELVDEQLRAGAGEMRGRITLAYNRNNSGILYLLPDLLQEFRNKFNQVSFSLQHMNEDRAIEALLEREITFACLAHPTRLRSLESFRLAQDQLVLAVPPNHAWSDQKIKLAELKGQNILIRATGSETRRQTEAALRAEGLSHNDLQIVAELDSAESLALCVEAALGMGFIVERIARHYMANGRMSLAYVEAEADTDNSYFSREIHLARLQNNTQRPVSLIQERFWEFLKASL